MDAAADAALVQKIAMSHNLIFESTELHLGKGASEAEARKLRYDFLRRISKKYNTLAMLTAHHKDDVIETAIINMLRGTGWRGLSSLRSRGDVLRPFLGIPKAELLAYAEEHDLAWRYDSTNDDMRYLRNRVRQQLAPKLTRKDQERFYQYIVRHWTLTEQIEHEADLWLQKHILRDSPVTSLPRYELIMVPQHVAHELLQEVLRRRISKSITRPLAEDALLFVRVAKAHKIFPLDANWQLRALPREVIVEQRPAVVS